MNEKIALTFGWIIEFLTYLLFPIDILLNLLGIILHFTNVNNSTTEKVSIILFEHWFTLNPWHILMKKFLIKRGFKVYWTNYSLLKGGNEEGARYLKNFIEENQISNFVLVGISSGAVCAFCYLQRYDGWQKTKKFISIAGPFRGSAFAAFLFFIKGGRQLMVGNPYLKKLLQKPIKNPSQIVCVYAKEDEIVPKSSSLIDNVPSHKVDVIGHDMLHMFSVAVFKFIAKEALKT